MPTSVVAEPIVNTTPAVVDAVVSAPLSPQVVEPVVDTWMKINPWFDWQVIFGIPFWVFVAAFLLLVFIIVNAYWFFRIKKLQPVRGYVDALKSSSHEDVMVWIISTTRNLTIECLKKRDSVLSFFDPVNITKWVHTSKLAVIHIGGKGGVIVSEDFYKTRDIVSEIALCSACDDYNQKLEALLLKSKENPTSDEKKLLDKMATLYKHNAITPISNYTDYETFGRTILEFLNPYGLETSPYTIYNPNAALKYFPEGLTATFNGGVFVRDSRKLNLGNNKLSFWEKVIPLGIIVGFIIIGIVAAWMVPL